MRKSTNEKNIILSVTKKKGAKSFGYFKIFKIVWSLKGHSKGDLFKVIFCHCSGGKKFCAAHSSFLKRGWNLATGGLVSHNPTDSL